jgi:hypothetical protein
MAESTLSSIEGMDSAAEPPKWTKLLLTVRKVVAASVLCGLMVASHAFGLAWQWAAATLGALGIAGTQTSPCHSCLALHWLRTACLGIGKAKLLLICHGCLALPCLRTAC